MSISLAWGIYSFSRTLRVRENHTITNLDARRDRENREKSDEIRSTSEHLRDGSRKPNAKDYLKSPPHLQPATTLNVPRPESGWLVSMVTLPGWDTVSRTARTYSNCYVFKSRWFKFMCVPRSAK